jgi:hypothetical protein
MRSIENKLGAEKPSKPEEVKRCELKLPMEIKRTTRICCEGRVLTGTIASRYHVNEKRVSTPVRRSERIQGMKRKDYKEVLPEPKDYKRSDYSEDSSPSSWVPEVRTMTSTIWKRCPRRRLQKALMVAVTPTTTATMMATMTAATLVMSTLSGCIRYVVRLASLHHRALRNGRQIFPGHGGDDATYGELGTSG